MPPGGARFRAALGAALLAAGCATAAPPPDRVPAGATAVEHTPIPEISDSRWRAPARPVARLVRTPVEWTELWTSLTGGTVPIPAPPPVDFHTEVVAFLSAGPGREIEIVGVWRAGDRLFVEAVETVPGPGCPEPPTSEAAVAAIRLDRWPAIEGRFLGRVETRACP